MLLLFWRVDGLVVGVPNDIKWYHRTDYVPRCFICGESGFSIANPFLNYPEKECSYSILPSTCTSVDVYQDHVIAGTENDGLFSLTWSGVVSSLCDVQSPKNLSSATGTFISFDGLLSQEIISIESNGNYLGVVTGSGFCYGKAGEASYVTYLTTSGKDCYVCQDDIVYFAEGNRVLMKEAPSDFSFWDQEYNVGSNINDIWVSENEFVNSLFVSTQSGIHVFQQNDSFSYGSNDYTQIKAERGTTINQGHLFAVASGVVDIINMRTKTLENSITFSGSAVLAVENKRIYSK